MFIGVDPGKRGAWALLRGDGAEANALPYTGSSVDVVSLLGSFPPADEVSMVMIETLGFRRQQSVQSAKTQSINWGKMVGAMAASGYRVDNVIPQVWQKTILGRLQKGKSKEASLAFAMNHFPEVDLMPGRCTTLQDGLADALCLAEYARRIVMAKNL